MHRNQLWSLISLLVALAFIIEGVVKAPGIAFGITAIVAGFAYATVTSLTRGQTGGRDRRSRRDRGRRRDR